MHLSLDVIVQRVDVPDIISVGSFLGIDLSRFQSVKTSRPEIIFTDTECDGHIIYFQCVSGQCPVTKRKIRTRSAPANEAMFGSAGFPQYSVKAQITFSESEYIFHNKL